MQAPFKITGEQPSTTVLLSDTFSDIYKPFHCVSCGNIVFSYNEEEIRTIIPSGHPQIDKPGKIYQCHGVMKLRSTSSIYDVLYEVMETVLRLDSIEKIHTAVAYIATQGQDETNARCKMLYFVS